MTSESGLLYYERAKQILEEVAETERGLTAQRGVASGRLHVSAPSLLGRLRLAPMQPGFLDPGLDRCDAGGSAGTLRLGGYRCRASHWTAGFGPGGDRRDGLSANSPSIAAIPVQ